MSHTTNAPARSIRRPALLGALVLTAALAACQEDAPSPLAPASGAVEARTPTNSGRPVSEAVVFTGFKDGNYDIYAMNPDGSNVRRLTTDTLHDVLPDFSPDNRKIVWARTSSAGVGELYTANADGSKQAPLTNIRKVVMDPRYSPDGTKIAFAAFDLGYQHEIYVINADGTGLKRLTYDASDERYPTWSPDGQKIAFESTRSGSRQIYVMNPDGLNVQPAFNCGYYGCGEPAYSPDGTKIAVSNLGYGNIAVFNVGGGVSSWVGPSLYLSSATAGRTSQHPTWTKDGTRVLFASDRGLEATMEIYVGTPGPTDAANIRRLTVFAPGFAWAPAYSH